MSSRRILPSRVPQPASSPGHDGGPSSKSVTTLPSASRRGTGQPATRVACFACRKRRSKCDGKRPTCTFCITKGTPHSCGYETEEGSSRIEQMRQKIRDLENEVAYLRAALMATNGGVPPAAFNPAVHHYHAANGRDNARQFSTASPRSLSPVAFPPVTPPAQSWDGAADTPRSRSLSSADGVLRITEMVSPNTEWCPPSQHSVSALQSSRESSEQTYQESGYNSGDDMQPDSTRASKRRRLIKTDEDDVEADFAHPSLSLTPSKKQASYCAFPVSVKSEGAQSFNDVLMLKRQGSRHGMPTPNFESNFLNMPFSSGLRANHYPEDIQGRQIANLSGPVHKAFPFNKIANIPTETVYESYITHCTDRIRDGESKQAVLGPVEIDARYLLSMVAAKLRAGFIPNLRDDAMDLMRLVGSRNIDLDHAKATHPLSTWAATMISAYDDNLTLVLALATLYHKHCWVRWRVDPTPENYKRLPACTRPTQAQLLIPHEVVSDHVPWARLRDTWILAPEILSEQREGWIQDFIMTTKLDWKGTWRDAVRYDEKTGTIRLTDAFMKCCDDDRNFTVGNIVKKRYPQLASTMAVREEDD